jgi:hypothetical protein
LASTSSTGDCTEGINRTVKVGSLWLHHASMLHHAIGPPSEQDAEQDDALWLQFHVWYAPTTAARRSSGSSRGVKGALHTLWETPLLSHQAPPLPEVALGLLRDLTLRSVPSGAVAAHVAAESKQPGDAPHERCFGEAHAVPLEVPSADLAALSEMAARAASELHPSGTFSESKMSVARALHWTLPPGASVPPQPAAAGLVRALFVLSASPTDLSSKQDHIQSHGATGHGGPARGNREARLRLQLLDPRPPSVRLPGRPPASWPFGTHNVFASPVTHQGSLLLMPAALSYMSASLARNASAAHWLELHLAPTPHAAKKAHLLPLPSGNMARCAPGQSSSCETSVDTVPASALTSVAPPLLHGPSSLELHATAVSTYRWRDATSLASIEAAARVVRRAAHAQPSASVSNMGGWQSAADFLMEERKLFEPLYPLVYQAIIEHISVALPAAAAPQLELRLSGWANANSEGHSNALHEHADQDWAISGVLYLDDGGDSNCTLAFRSPIPPSVLGGGATTNMPAHLAQPVAGQVVVFPSWLQHWVPPHCGSRRRLSVAFNAAALLPTRMWPDGGRATPVPNLAAILKESRKAARKRRRPRRSAPRPLGVEGSARTTRANDVDSQQTARAEWHGEEDGLHRLWPLHVTAARAESSAKIDRAMDCALSGSTSTAPGSALTENGPGMCTGSGRSHRALNGACDSATGVCESTSSDGHGVTMATVQCCLRLRPALELTLGCVDCESTEIPMGALIEPIGVAVRAHLANTTGDGSGTGIVHLSLELMSTDHHNAQDGRARQSRGHGVAHTPLAQGLFFPPSAADSRMAQGAEESRGASREEANDGSSTWVLLPDVRHVAGDLASSMMLHEQMQRPRAGTDSSWLAAPSGSVFVYPSWARSFIHSTPRTGVDAVRDAVGSDGSERRAAPVLRFDLFAAD